MAKKKAPKLPEVKPQELLRQQDMYNRVNIATPFGSQTYSSGPDGRGTYNTQLSPQMQSLIDMKFGQAAKQSTPFQLPEGMAALINALMQKQMTRYGAGGG